MIEQTTWMTIAYGIASLACTDGIPGAIGPQLGGRVTSSLDAIQKAQDSQVLACSTDLSLENSAKPAKPNVIGPIVYGFNVCVGDLPIARRDTA